MKSMTAPTLRIQRVTTTLRNQVVERLRWAICEQQLPQGARLIERQLCEMLGVSRTLVREALRELEAEGLVTSVPHRGPSVAVLDRETAKGIYEVRAVLEALAGRLFVERATAEDRRRLVKAAAVLDRARDRGDIALQLRATAGFYEVLFAGARNEVIAATLRPLSGRIHMLRARSMATAGRKVESKREMDAIVAAAQGDDPDQAWASCLRHVQQAALCALQSFPDDIVPAAETKAPAHRAGKPAKPAAQSVDIKSSEGIP
jgi:GntR family transcriptional regulator, trigonelline degradation regulator